MSDSIVISKEETRNRVRRFFPDYDFTKPLAKQDWFRLLKVIRDKEFAEEMKKEAEQEKKRIAARLAEIRKKDISPGCLVKDQAGDTRQVTRIDSAGRLILKGRKGSFHPIGWDLAKR